MPVYRTQIDIPILLPAIDFYYFLQFLKSLSSLSSLFTLLGTSHLDGTYIIYKKFNFNCVL